MPSIGSRRVLIDDQLRPAAVRVESGVIVGISETVPDVDFGDLVLLPGLVDAHVHVNDPGRADWEGFDTATRAAAAGGTTTIVDMPLNSLPPTVDTAALALKKAAARDRISVDVAFWGGVVPGSGSEIVPLVAAGVCGLKVFMADSGVPEYPPLTSSELEDAARAVGGLAVPLLVHAEDPASLESVPPGTTSHVAYERSRPVEAESRAIGELSRLADDGTRIHVLHVSSAEGVDLIAAGPQGLTGETCPHYLTFASEEVPDGATQYKCAPPIRGTEHREALWEGLGTEALAIVVSDHSPSPVELKRLDTGDFAAAWGGISSLQLRLPVTWDGASRRGYGLVELARWLSRAPAELAGLDARKGRIAVGADADFVVFDPDGVTIADASKLEHRHPITPYHGMRLRGRVMETRLGGVPVYRDGVVSGGRGKMLSRR